jgi:hypothetical protein
MSRKPDTDTLDWAHTGAGGQALRNLLKVAEHEDRRSS